MSPVRYGLRDKPERKPIIMENYYAALNYRETLEHEKDHIMVNVHLHGKKQTVNNQGNNRLGSKRELHRPKGLQQARDFSFLMIQTTNTWQIYLVDGKPSAMGLVTHMTEVPMDISSHRELTTFQLANLENHELMLGILWLMQHNLKIDWNDTNITFNDERCTTWCLNSWHLAYAIPEEKPLEQTLIIRV